MRALLDAVGFLTVLPVGGVRAAPRPAAVAFFPVVGVLVGLVWALVAEGVFALNLGGIAAITGAFVLLADALVTGALHLDALGDVADGVASRRDGDVALRIMREPATGAVGAAAITHVALLRFALLFSALEPAYRLVAVPVAGRAAMVWLLAQVPVRDDSSLAFAFTRPRKLWVVAGLLIALVAVSLAANVRGVIGLVLAVAFASAWGAWWRRRFGGLTGDGIGACAILAETIALVVIAVRG